MEKREKGVYIKFTESSIGGVINIYIRKTEKRMILKKN